MPASARLRRDVVEREHRAGEDAVGHDRRGRVRDREDRPVLSDVRIVLAVHDLAGAERPQERTLLVRERAPVRPPVVDGRVHVAAEKLLFRPTEQPLGGRVHEADPPVEVERVNPFGHAAGDSLQASALGLSPR